MDEIFAALSEGLERAPGLATLAAFGWGLVSVALSPCHLMSVPLAVGYLGAGDGPRRSVLALSVVLAAAGLVALAAIGGITVAAGRIAGDVWGVGPWLAAALLVFAGLALLDVVSLPSFGAGGSTRMPRGLRGATLLGATLGLTLGPCTFAFMAPVLGAAIAAPPAAAVAVLVGFALGHTAAVAGAGLAGARVARWLGAGGRFTAAAKGTIGVLLLATAVYLVATAP